MLAQQAAGGLCLPPACPPLAALRPAPARPSFAAPAALVTDSPVAAPARPSLVLSGHPDAQRRRLEAEQRREHSREQVEIAQQPRWFEGPLPSNFQRVATPEAFLEAVAGEGLIVADFFVPWCVACRRFHPALTKLAAAHPDCTFLSVNGADSALHEFVASLGVDRLPYFQFYRAGRILSQFAANLSKLKLLRREIERCKEQVLQAGGSSIA